MSNAIQDSLFTLHDRGSISPWTVSFAKRFFDATFAFFLLVLAAPLILVIALVLKISSPGPVLFRQTRVGQNGRPFTMLKFRSMRTNTGRQTNLTPHGDQRITPVGRILRKTKLDELPQLYNVVCGDMSMVGPRPDMPEYIATLKPRLQLALLLKPGITSLASLKFRDEEIVLAQVRSDQLQTFYIETQLPRKLDLELNYARTASLGSDLKLILRTVGVLFSREFLQ